MTDSEHAREFRPVDLQVDLFGQGFPAGAHLELGRLGARSSSISISTREPSIAFQLPSFTTAGGCRV